MSRVDNLYGSAFDRNMSVDAKFASKWSLILGCVHRTASLLDLRRKIHAFATIPAERRLSTSANHALMADLFKGDVLQAISALSRHKSAGPDGLNNVFYKDTSALFVPAPVVVSNEILHGKHMPPSFLKALVIQFRNREDSADALDYRLISLLQTSYKTFAKVLATRLQRLVPLLFGDSQQGIVRGRQMLKLVTMMLIHLSSSRDEADLFACFSRVILLLDFCKAYDTVDREFYTNLFDSSTLMSRLANS